MAAASRKPGKSRSKVPASPLVGIIMGSQSDWSVMRHAAETLAALGVPYEARIVSAHRTPERLYAYADSAQERGLKVIIAGAGGAAHLPGMTASMTPLPVLGVPVAATGLQGFDSLLSIVQMPGGVPVGSDYDFATGYLRHVLGFVGITDVTEHLVGKVDQIRVVAVPGLVDFCHELVTIQFGEKLPHHANSRAVTFPAGAPSLVHDHSHHWGHR